VGHFSFEKTRGHTAYGILLLRQRKALFSGVFYWNQVANHEGITNNFVSWGFRKCKKKVLE